MLHVFGLGLIIFTVVSAVPQTTPITHTSSTTSRKMDHRTSHMSQLDILRDPRIKQDRQWAEGQPCPDGWLHFNDSCYWGSTSPLSWFAAEHHCRTFGYDAHLASVHSVAENNRVQALASCGATWIGLTKMVPSAQSSSTTDGWAWTDMSDNDYTEWKRGQPVGGGDERNCAFIGMASTVAGGSGWASGFCTETRVFTCKADAKVNSENGGGNEEAGAGTGGTREPDVGTEEAGNSNGRAGNSNGAMRNSNGRPGNSNKLAGNSNGKAGNSNRGSTTHNAGSGKSGPESEAKRDTRNRNTGNGRKWNMMTTTNRPHRSGHTMTTKNSKKWLKARQEGEQGNSESPVPCRGGAGWMDGKNGYCYFYSADTANWFRAESWCRNQSASLLDIKDETEQRLAMLGGCDRRTWLGAVKWQPEQNWHWDNDMSSVGTDGAYTNWAQNNTGANYVVAFMDTTGNGAGRWYDTPSAHELMFYICKQEIGGPEEPGGTGEENAGGEGIDEATTVETSEEDGGGEEGEAVTENDGADEGGETARTTAGSARPRGTSTTERDEANEDTEGEEGPVTTAGTIGGSTGGNGTAGGPVATSTTGGSTGGNGTAGGPVATGTTTGHAGDNGTASGGQSNVTGSTGNAGSGAGTGQPHFSNTTQDSGEPEEGDEGTGQPHFPSNTTEGNGEPEEGDEGTGQPHFPSNTIQGNAGPAELGEEGDAGEEGTVAGTPGEAGNDTDENASVDETNIAERAVPGEPKSNSTHGATTGTHQAQPATSPTANGPISNTTKSSSSDTAPGPTTGQPGSTIQHPAG